MHLRSCGRLNPVFDVYRYVLPLAYQHAFFICHVTVLPTLSLIYVCEFSSIQNIRLWYALRERVGVPPLDSRIRIFQSVSVHLTY